MAANDDEARVREALTKVRVEEILLGAVFDLVQVAYAKVGAIPEAQEALDLDQARLAIDGIAGLGGLLQDRLPPENVQEIRQALAQLQMVWVRQAEAAGILEPEPDAPGGGPAGGAGAPPRQAPRDPGIETPPRPKIWTPRGDV